MLGGGGRGREKLPLTRLCVYFIQVNKFIFDYAEKSPFAVFGFRAPEAPKNGSKKLIEN